MTNSDKVIKRIRTAVVMAGVSRQTISDRAGITYFRMASVINTEAYRHCTRFTEEEVIRINNVLDSIKKAI